MLQGKIKEIVFQGVVPMVGMAFFWAFMRYQTFLGVLFPSNTPVASEVVGFPSHMFFLAVLAALCILAMAGRKHVERLFLGWCPVPLVCALGGSVGTALLLVVPDASASGVLAVVSVVLVALGYLSVLCLWGVWFSRGFGTRELAVVSAGYLLSLLMFVNSAQTDSPLQTMKTLVVLTPVASSVCWLVAALGTGGSRHLDEGVRDGSDHSLERLLFPTVGLFILFLLAGSIVRGIVDATVTDIEVRRHISLPIMSALVIACIVYALPRWRSGDGGEAGKNSDLDRVGPFVLVCWIVFASVFFLGVFVFLVSADGTVGGNLVVVARSMLEVSFWMLLCDLAHRGKVAPVPLFLCGGALVETVSWALSYVLVPGILTVAADSSTTLVLVTIFGLISIITVLCGVLVIVSGRSRLLIPANDWLPRGEVSQQKAEPTEAAPVQVGDDWEALSEELVQRDGLTFREASVAVRYAHGYSIAKVSEELGVTVSAAQSSIRSVYRKLDVHTKDDLIGVVDGLRDKR